MQLELCVKLIEAQEYLAPVLGQAKIHAGLEVNAHTFSKTGDSVVLSR